MALHAIGRAVALLLLSSSLAACGDKMEPIVLPELVDTPLKVTDDSTDEQRVIHQGRSGTVGSKNTLFVVLDDQPCFSGVDAHGMALELSLDLAEGQTGEVEAYAQITKQDGHSGISAKSRVVIDEFSPTRIKGRVSARIAQYTALGAFDVPRCDASTPVRDASVDARPTLEPQGCAVQLVGQGSRIEVSDTQELLARDFTAELWVKLDAFHPDAQAAQHFMAVEGHGPIDALGSEVRPTLYLGVWGESVACQVGVAETTVVSRAAFPVDERWLGAWHHVACTRDDDYLGLWIDGKLAGFDRMPHPPPTPAYPVVFGFAPVGTNFGTLGIRGQLDEVRISSAVLYPFTVYEDVGSNLFKTDAPSFVPAARPTATRTTRMLWHFDECSGASTSNAADATRYSGTLEAGASWVP